MSDAPVPLVSKSQVRRIIHLLTATIPAPASKAKAERKSWHGLKIGDMLEFLDNLKENGGTAPKLVYKVTNLTDAGVSIESVGPETQIFMVRSKDWKEHLRRIPVREQKQRELI